MNIDRYARHKTLVELGKEGQNFLAKGSAAVVGCGGLGATASMLLARCGVGSLIIIDRDIVELHNLQRQILYLEEDVGKPKAKVAKERLEQMNSEIRIQAHQESLDHSNLYMLEGADVIVDATDNLTTRFLLNDYAVKNKIPWVYGGAVGTEGMTATFMPESACFRCMFPNMPPPGTLATCESAGVLGTLPNMIASLQATEAIKLLAGAFPRSTILYVDPWHGVFKEAPIEKNKNCPCCGAQQYPYLEAKERNLITVFCDGGKVQITPARKAKDLVETLRKRYEDGVVRDGAFVVSAEGAELVVFDDGRALVMGRDEEGAKRLYSSFVGW